MAQTSSTKDSLQPEVGKSAKSTERELFDLAVRFELSRVLASPQFENSKRLQRFLSFIVESTLQGNTSHLKESLIGVQVFDRDAGFDPKQDPVVRVTARRLREKLEEFYVSEGEKSQVLIQLTKGSYIPTLVARHSGEVTRYEEVGSPQVEYNSGVLESPAPLPRQSRFSKRRLFVLIAGLLALVTLTVLARFGLGGRESGYGYGPVSRFSIDLPPDQELLQYYGSNLAFSPDGRSLAYVAKQNGTFRLFVRDLSQSQSHAIPESEGAAAPLYSLDGNTIIAYVSGHIRRFPIKGGHTDLAAVAPKLALFGAAWDGQSLLYDDAPPEVLSQGLASVYRVIPGSNIKPVRITSRPAALSGDESQMIQQSLPGGKGYLLSIHGTQEWIAIVSSDGSRKQIVSNARGGMYLPTGHLAFWSSGDLKVAPMSLSRLELTGPEVTAVKNVGFSGWEGAEVALSPQGTLAYVERSPHLSDRQLVWVDHSGKQTPLPIPPAPIEPLNLSPNGKNLLLARYDGGDQRWTLWNYSLSDGSSMQLTEPSRNLPYACWSPDGRSIVYASNRISGQATNLFLRSSSGGSEDSETQITRFEEGGMVPYSWSGDGKWLLGTRGMLLATKSDIFAVPMSPFNAEKGGPRPVVQTPDYDGNPDLSPDGRWLAYETENQVFVQRFPGGAETAPVVVGNGRAPLWDPSGQKIYFRHGRSLMEIPVYFDPTLRLGTPSVLFASDLMPPDLWIRDLLLSRDGKRFLMVVDEKNKTEGHRINIVVNWFTEVRRLFHPQL